MFLLFQVRHFTIKPINVKKKRKKPIGVVKPKYFRKQSSWSSFFLTKVIIQVQNGNGVLNSLVSCLKCMELAY